MESDSNSSFPLRAGPAERPSAHPLRPTLPVGSSRVAVETPGLTLSDIYFTLFRHQRRILLCAFLGLVAAVALFRYAPPPYQSEAKLFVRYVMENRATGPGGDSSRVKSLDPQGESILSSELEILTSLDLLGQVVDAVGSEKVAPQAAPGTARQHALGVVARDFSALVSPQSRVIHLTFKHPDPAVAQSVLREVIDRYLKKHVEIHRALGMTGDFLSEETDELRSRLARTEEELREANRKVGAVSVEEAKRAATEQFARIRQEIFTAEAEYAERSALLPESEPLAPAPGMEKVVPPPTAAVDEYRDLDARITSLRRREQELLVLFTDENSRVKELRAQLAAAAAAKRTLEAEHPGLVGFTLARPALAGAANTSDALKWLTDTARLRALQSKIKVLHSQLDEIRNEVARLERIEGSVQELRRKRELEEANYRYYSASLEQSRIDEAVGAGRVSNISEIQSPSMPVRNWPKKYKLLAGIASSGLVFGLAWAFAIEMLLDRTVKRASDLERTVRLPHFLTIPNLGRGPRSRGSAARWRRPRHRSVGPVGPTPSEAALAAGAAEIPAWDPAHALYPFHETLRDRLVAYFESIGLTHKPKLVAVTGLTRQSGVTTIATGLAQRLSETGEGNVLLVDMTAGQGSAQQFVKGEAVRGLDELLDTREPGSVTQSKLFVVTENGPHERLSRNLPQRFSKLVPRLKASDFDYIILDMPPVSQLSVTPRLAGFMDMVLLVVEAEKTDRELVRRAAALLAESKARIGTVLNRVHSYVPRRLCADSLGDL